MQNERDTKFIPTSLIRWPLHPFLDKMAIPSLFLEQTLFVMVSNENNVTSLAYLLRLRLNIGQQEQVRQLSELRTKFHNA